MEEPSILEQNLTLLGCNFVRNSNVTYTTAQDPSDPQEFGGAIFIDGGALTVSNCLFQANYASGYVGGAIACEAPGIIANSTFTGNIADGASGGAIYFHRYLFYEPLFNSKVVNCTFANNRASTNADNNFGNGGAIYSLHNLTVENCTFWSNSVKGGSGGAIYK